MNKLTALLHSRKFWTLVVSLVTIAGAFATHQADALAALIAAITALSVYSVATGIEDAGRNSASTRVITSTTNPPNH